MTDETELNQAPEQLSDQCSDSSEELQRRLKGELLVVEAKNRVDEELARQKVIQRFVDSALELIDPTELIELTLEAAVEAYECETAVFLSFDPESSELVVKEHFDDEFIGQHIACPQTITERKAPLLIQSDQDLLKALRPIGIANGAACSFSGESDNLRGMVVAGTTFEEVDTYTALSEDHLSSFSVLVSQAASFHNNILLHQKVKGYVSELEEYRASLENKVEERTQELEGLSRKLAKYLSPQIYDSIFSGEQEVILETKRKKLTIFFSDIKNFTATTDDLEPEDITFLVNDYLTEMSSIALKHGATIDKFIGDAILIFFGDPSTLGVQEDALACVRMAIEMQRHMVGLRAKWVEMGYERPFQMRVGINTGFCNVGNFGSDKRMDYTIIGGEVNLAARLEGVSDPDGIMVSYETYALIKDFIDAEPCEPIHVKGIHRKINPYRLIGIFKNVDEENRFIRAENDGMKLFLDFDKLDENTRPDAIQRFETALERLRAASDEPDQ